jgi:SAM-dependent methyltransferase
MEELKECPACKGTKHTFVRKCKDFTVSAEEFKIVQCDGCSLQFTNPRPNSVEIGRYYESPDYISHSNSTKGLINKIYRIVRNHSIKKKLNLITRLNKDKEQSIIDIGCGTGEFLGICQQNGWKALGIEPNEKARKQAETNWNLEVHPESYLEKVDNKNKPNIISMWHVLEHVHLLNERLRQVHNILAENGHLIIAVPNPSSWDASHYTDTWAAYDVPRHLYHFSPEVLIDLLTKFGFEHIESKPMAFDSFYVSMLSEKYMHGHPRNLNAVINGIRSNLSAGGEAEKYSSVIYVFKKKQ